MPEQLLGRILRASSYEGDVVLDPFAGSGTTLAVAKKLRRIPVGFELSKQYFNQATKRLKSAIPGTPLDGVDDPLTSAPQTPSPRARRSAAGTHLQPLLFLPPDIESASTGRLARKRRRTASA